MTENTEVQKQEQELAKFAQEQNCNQQYLEYFNDIFIEAGVKDISKMTNQDAERLMQVLKSSEASREFVKALLAQAAVDGMSSQVLEYILSSDIDGDGRTLAQEIFHDGTDPFEADTSEVTSRQNYVTNSQTQNAELEI